MNYVHCRYFEDACVSASFDAIDRQEVGGKRWGGKPKVPRTCAGVARWMQGQIDIGVASPKPLSIGYRQHDK